MNTYSLRFDIVPAYAQQIVAHPCQTAQQSLKAKLMKIIGEVLEKCNFVIDGLIAGLEHPNSNAHMQCIIWSKDMLTHAVRNQFGTLYHKLPGIYHKLFRKKDLTKKKDQIMSFTKARLPYNLANYTMKEDQNPLVFNINDDLLEEIKKHDSKKALEHKFEKECQSYLSTSFQPSSSARVEVYMKINAIHESIYHCYITKTKYWRTLHRLGAISDSHYCMQMNIFNN